MPALEAPVQHRRGEVDFLEFPTADVGGKAMEGEKRIERGLNLKREVEGCRREDKEREEDKV
jgi:hypothetical protein